MVALFKRVLGAGIRLFFRAEVLIIKILFTHRVSFKRAFMRRVLKFNIANDSDKPGYKLQNDVLGTRWRILYYIIILPALLNAPSAHVVSWGYTELKTGICLKSIKFNLNCG